MSGLRGDGDDAAWWCFPLPTQRCDLGLVVVKKRVTANEGAQNIGQEVLHRLLRGGLLERLDRYISRGVDEYARDGVRF